MTGTGEKKKVVVEWEEYVESYKGTEWLYIAYDVATRKCIAVSWREAEKKDVASVFAIHIPTSNIFATNKKKTPHLLKPVTSTFASSMFAIFVHVQKKHTAETVAMEMWPRLANCETVVLKLSGEKVKSHGYEALNTAMRCPAWI